MAINTFDVVIKYTPEELENYLDALETEVRLVRRIINRPRVSRALPKFDKIKLWPMEALKENPSEASKILKKFLNGSAVHRLYSTNEITNFIQRFIQGESIIFPLKVSTNFLRIEDAKLHEMYFIVEPA